MRITGVLSAVAFLLSIPAGIAIALAGHEVGLYPYAAVPFAFGGVLVGILVLMTVLLPKVKRWEMYGN